MSVLIKLKNKAEKMNFILIAGGLGEKD